ncbi:MAG: hypothetical protein ACSHWU_06315 [Marinicella sp.]
MKYKNELKTTPLFLIMLLQFAWVTTNAGDVIQPPELLFVGDSGACTYASIQAAIDDAPPNSEIRVTNEINAGVLIENIEINKNLIIKGGYTTCGLAQLDSRADDNRTVVDGTNSGNVIKIDGDDLVVDLSGFTLTNGEDEGFGPGRANGGAVSIRGNDFDISFDQMTINNNHGRLGGGIYLTGESGTIRLFNSTFIENSAFSGGGLYCNSTGIENIVQYGSINIIGNQATGSTESNGHGGGLYLSGCRLSQSGELNSFSMNHNFANNSGGGIYMVDAGISILKGILWSNMANADSNDTGDGGGIFASGMHQLVINRTEFFENQVNGGHGGGIHAVNTRLQVLNTLYENCFQAGDSSCLHFQSNRALPILGGTATLGGAIYLDNSILLNFADLGSALDHFPGYFEDNHADFGTALALNNGSRFSMQNAYFVGNGADGTPGFLNNSVVWLSDADTELSISFSTLADNQVNSVFNVQSNASLNLATSIVYEQDASNLVLVNNLASVTTHCNVYHEGESVPILIGEPSIVTTDPGFVDHESGDYHLRPDSIAIDRCDDGGFEFIYPDRDQDVRPFDISETENGVGQFDAGADEYNDLIYQNGFESI